MAETRELQIAPPAASLTIVSRFDDRDETKKAVAFPYLLTHKYGGSSGHGGDIILGCGPCASDPDFGQGAKI